MQNKITRILCSFLFLVFLFNANAQEGFVKYRQILNLDSTLYSTDTLGVPAFLYFNDNRSLYVYNRSKDKEESKPFLEKLAEGASEVSFDEKDFYGNMFYKDFSTSQLLIRRLVWGKAYLTEEPLPLHEWTILPEFHQIGTFNCRKAQTKFRGRDYEAWFCPDIPVKNGPWKFDGLPGLIMDIYDTNKEVRIFIEELHVPFHTEELIKPVDGKYISFEEFKHIEQKETEKIVRFLQSISERGNDDHIEFGYYPIEKDYE